VRRGLAGSGHFPGSAVPPRIFIPGLRENAGMQLGWSSPYGYISLTLGRVWNYMHDGLVLQRRLHSTRFPRRDRQVRAVPLRFHGARSGVIRGHTILLSIPRQIRGSILQARLGSFATPVKPPCSCAPGTISSHRIGGAIVWSCRRPGTLVARRRRRHHALRARKNFRGRGNFVAALLVLADPGIRGGRRW